jgi:hypothetical protein
MENGENASVLKLTENSKIDNRSEVVGTGHCGGKL